jgi:hypothetical protein
VAGSLHLGQHQHRLAQPAVEAVPRQQHVVREQGNGDLHRAHAIKGGPRGGKVAQPRVPVDKYAEGHFFVVQTKHQARAERLLGPDHVALLRPAVDHVVVHNDVERKAGRLHAVL